MPISGILYDALGESSSGSISVEEERMERLTSTLRI